jgi:hypothetical protein
MLHRRPISISPAKTSPGGVLSVKPFIRSLSEFKFWCSRAKGVFFFFYAMTFFSASGALSFLAYIAGCWTIFFVLIMKRQILHIGESIMLLRVGTM